MKKLSDLPSIAEIERELCVRSLYEFVQIFWNVVDPADLVLDTHVKVICDHLEAVFSGEMLRLAVAIPPAHSKSTICSVLFPAWCFAKDPSFKIAGVSADNALAVRDSRRCRMLMESEKYQQIFPEVKLIPDNNRLTSYVTSKGGYRDALTVRMQITGKHYNCVIIDDPVRPQDLFVDGTKALEGIWNWFSEVLSTRFVDINMARKIIIAQRLHEADLTGKVLASDEPWEHLCLPLEFEPERAFKTSLCEDWRTQPGQLLSPKRFPEAAVDQLKKALGTPRSISSQLQQNPIPAEGSIFLADWFKATYDNLPRSYQTYLSVDATFKKSETSDYVVVTKWAAAQGKFYLVDVIRRRMSFLESLEAIQGMIAASEPIAGVLVEMAANGEAITEVLRKNHVRVIPIKPLGGKISRAEAASPVLASGSVLFPSEKPSWWTTYLSEMLSFPSGAFDDQVDSTTQLLTYLTSNQSNVSGYLQKIAKGKLWL